MKITFCGAADGVTGSCHLIETDRYRFLLDCGMFQGGRKNEERNKLDFPFDPSSIDFVILSHAHVDHCGRLPLLVKRGFSGPIYCTDATADLVDVMLRDCAYIQEREIEYRNKKHERCNRPLEEPLYRINDAIECLKHLTPVLYGSRKKIVEGIELRFNEAGHILGSAASEIWITEQETREKTTKIVFSGDLGMKDRPILRDPQYIHDADVVIMETTYGNRRHEKNLDGISRLAEVIQKTIRRGGTAIIPAFAVGRTQDMLYDLSELLKNNRDFAKTMEKVKVYVDSPMAETATEIFKKNAQVYDEEAREMIMNGINPLGFKNLVFVKDAFESQALNANREPKVIISASGMCEAGRIKHHLKHNLWDARNSVIFVGYQAQGTLGRSLVEGAQEVKIFGEPIHVAAEIYDLKGFSGHADVDGLVDWLSAFTPKPAQVFLVHGEKESKLDFAKTVEDRLGISPVPIVEPSSADLSGRLTATNTREREELARLEELRAMRSRLSDIHHMIEHLLYTTELAADGSMRGERIQAINDILLSLEKDTMNLGSAVTDETGSDRSAE